MQSRDNVFTRPLRRTPTAFQHVFWTFLAAAAAGIAALVVLDPSPHPGVLLGSPGFLVLAGLVVLADLYPWVPWLMDVRDEPVFIWSAALSLAAILAYGPWAALLFLFSGLMAPMRRPGSRWWRMVLNSAMLAIQGLLAAGVLVLLGGWLPGADGTVPTQSDSWALLWVGIALAVVLQVANGAILGLATVSLGVATIRSEISAFVRSIPVCGISLLFAPLFAEMALTAAELLPLLIFGILALHQVQGAINRSSRQARTDPLTGLANRVALLQSLGRLLMTGDRVGVTVLVMDLDGFKAVNDTYGHPVGDDVLVTFARRLAGAVEPSDLVARYGGDEFAVVIGGDQADQDIRDLVGRLTTAIGRPVRVGLDEVTVSASVGVATATDVVTTPMELIGRADRAMYRTKSAQSHGAPGPIGVPIWSVSGPEMPAGSAPPNLAAARSDVLDVARGEL